MLCEECGRSFGDGSIIARFSGRFCSDECCKKFKSKADVLSLGIIDQYLQGHDLANLQQVACPYPVYWPEDEASWGVKPKWPNSCTFCEAPPKIWETIADYCKVNVLVGPAKQRWDHEHYNLLSAHSAFQVKKEEASSLKFASTDDRISVKKIKIHKILICKNPELWKAYYKTREDIFNLHIPPSDMLLTLRKRYEVFDLPIINPVINESLLFHGTGKDVMKIITNTNFDPEFTEYSRFKGYGRMGLGAYFTDQAAKAITYVRCRKCGKSTECNCLKSNGTPVLRALFLCRVVLGNVKVKPSSKWDRHAHNQELLLGSAPLSKIKGNDTRDSRGFHSLKDYEPNSSFVARTESQVYPEFIVYYTVNDIYEKFLAAKEAQEERRMQSSNGKVFNSITDDDL